MQVLDQDRPFGGGMMRAIALIVVLSVTANLLLLRNNRRLSEERDRYRENTEVMLGEISRHRFDSARNAVESSRMQLTIDEYKQYRKEDLATIERLGVNIKRLKASAQHQVVTEVAMEIPVRDSVVIRDTIVKVPAIRLNSPYIHIDAVVENDSLKGTLRLNTRLRQYIHTVPKYRFLWWRWGVKGVRQTIVSDNPYVSVEYSEFITISK